MRRRTLLGGLLGCAAVAATAGWQGVGLLFRAAGRPAPAPPDLLARLRRNTRPLDPAKLREPHDLAG